MFRKWIWICVIALMGIPLWAEDQDRAIKRKREEMASERRVALVIGNAAYRKDALRNPVNDASAMAAALRACGFTVLKHTDLNRIEMFKAVREFGNNIERGGVGLFYYSGHGIQVDGQNYLVPVDADIEEEDEVESECLGVKLVLAKMETADNRVNILILDACRNNRFGSQNKSLGDGGLANIKKVPTGTLIAFATRPGEVAKDGIGMNSPYTAALVEVMRKRGLMIEQVFKDVREKVKRETAGKQVPREITELEGDFYFLPPSQGTFSSSPLPSPPQGDSQARHDHEKTTFKEYQRLADRGDVKTQYKLGVMHYEGFFINPYHHEGGITIEEFQPANYQEAEKWFRKAANQGHAGAQDKLGEMYYEGHGVPKNYKKAEEWFRKAIHQGHAGAQDKLGEMYYKLGEKDYKRLVEGEGLLRDIISFIGLYDPSKDYKKAEEWFRKAANQGHAGAQYKLGEMYYKGRGMPKDYIQAHMWFNLAAAQEMDEARSKLEEIESKMTAAQIAEAQRQPHEIKKR